MYVCVFAALRTAESTQPIYKQKPFCFVTFEVNLRKIITKPPNKMSVIESIKIETLLCYEQHGKKQKSVPRLKGDLVTLSSTALAAMLKQNGSHRTHFANFSGLSEVVAEK